MVIRKPDDVNFLPVRYERSTSTFEVTPLSLPTRAILMGVLAGLPIALFGFLLGMFWQDRGWGALVVFAIVLAAVTIRDRNR